MEVARPRLSGQPPVDVLYAPRYAYDWEHLWKYVIVRPSVKAVGLAVKTYGNKRGRQVRPGIRRLMVVTGHTKPTVIDALAQMRWLGFLWRISTSRGSNSADADVYQLCLPRSLDHLAVVDKKTAHMPTFDELPPIAQQTVFALGVEKRFGETSGCLSQPGGKAGQPLVVNQAYLEWWPQLTPPIQLPKHSTHSSQHHSDSSESGSRASSRATKYDFGDPDDCYDYVYEAAGGGYLNPAEASTIDGMLANGVHPKVIVNTINKMRDEAA